MESSAHNESIWQRKPNNMVAIPVEEHSLDFYKQWCVLHRPFVKLTDKEIEVVACFLLERWKLTKTISDPAILDKVLISTETKEKVAERCEITIQHLHVIMNSLRKNKVFIGNVLNPKLVPNQREDDNGLFLLVFMFKTTS